MPLSKEEMDEFLAEARVAVLATVDARGDPRAVPIWYIYEDGAFHVISGAGASKTRSVRRSGRATICVEDRTRPYRVVLARGGADVVQDGVREWAYRIARHYLGPEEGDPEAESWLRYPTVVLRLTPDHVTSWDYSRDE